MSSDGYREVQKLTCINVMHGRLHIANVFHHKDGRWYYHPGSDARHISRTCARSGYDTSKAARDAAIVAAMKGDIHDRP